MENAQTRDFWDRRGALMVLAGVLLPPLAWLLDMQVSYSMIKWVCAHDRRGLLFVPAVVSLGLIAYAGWLSWSVWIVARGGREEGDEPIDRSYMLAICGLALSALFGLLVLVSLTPRVFLSPCE